MFFVSFLINKYQINVLSTTMGITSALFFAAPARAVGFVGSLQLLQSRLADAWVAAQVDPAETAGCDVHANDVM